MTFGVGCSPVRVSSAAEDILAQRHCPGDPDTVLEQGAGGLGFFRRFHEVASQLGIDDRSLESYDRAYRAESGVDLAAFALDVSDTAAAVRGSSVEYALAAACVESLPEVWDVTGVDAVVRQVRNVQQESNFDVESTSLLVTVSEDLSRVVRTAVSDKAFKIASLDRHTVGGLDRPTIDQLLGGGSSVENPAVRWWVDTMFRPVYVDARDEFDRACAECSEALTRAFDAAADLIEELFPLATGGAGREDDLVPSAVPTALASLNIAGDQWGLSMAADGRGVAVDILRASGQAVSVRLELDANGIPRFTVESPAVESRTVYSPAVESEDPKAVSESGPADTAGAPDSAVSSNSGPSNSMTTEEVEFDDSSTRVPGGLESAESDVAPTESTTDLVDRPVPEAGESNGARLAGSGPL
ncbi:hypothetical protein ABH922_003194 [Rhodococcus sp. 27YEA15]|uniref:hypothetical protein n=1 Tax=Rhodococcus sp. 27YEA15 TaxID=3156259 RepID=UPI003C7D419D